MVSTLIMAVALAAANIAVYPLPGNTTASPTTQISFRGTTDLGTVTVTGSQTGRHPGRVREHSDGQGASFVTSKRFAQGETVRVKSAAKSYSFKIGRRPTPSNTRNVSPDPDAGAMSFVSEPGLKPPKVTISTARDGRSPGYVFMGPKGGRQMGPMIIDDEGELVWFRKAGAGKVAMDVRPQTYDGKPVLTWWEGKLFGGGGRGVGMVLDERYRTVERVKMGNGFQADSHEFTITPQGTALFNAWDAVNRPEGRVLQSVVQEVDIKTGLVLFEWHSAGHIATSETYRPRESPRTPWDYLHLNSVAVDAQGNFILSARSTSTVYKVARADGKIIWRLGGKKSSLKLGKGVRFEQQHDARPGLDGTITLFDNANPKRSRALTLKIDGNRASVVRALTHPDDLKSSTQGSMQPLANGNTFVGWGSQRWFSEFDASGKIIFDGSLAKGNDNYRAYRGEWVGTPGGRPTAVRRGKTLRVSWNGATQIASWQVGDQTYPRTGFETSVPAASKSTVKALDANGTVLGESAAS